MLTHQPKTSTSALRVLLRPLPAPHGKFEYCTLDFVTGLRELDSRKALLVTVHTFFYAFNIRSKLTASFGSIDPAI